MGTPMAPAVADLFIEWLERKILENSSVTDAKSVEEVQ